MIRDILDYKGNMIGQLELPDDTSEDVWQEKLAVYAEAPVKKASVDIVADRIKVYKDKASDILAQILAANVVAGITAAQSDAVFDDYADVILRIREGAWPTALYRLQQKVPSGFVSQDLLDSWIYTLQSNM